MLANQSFCVIPALLLISCLGEAWLLCQNVISHKPPSGRPVEGEPSVFKPMTFLPLRYSRWVAQFVICTVISCIRAGVSHERPTSFGFDPSIRWVLWLSSHVIDV